MIRVELFQEKTKIVFIMEIKIKITQYTLNKTKANSLNSNNKMEIYHKMKIRYMIKNKTKIVKNHQEKIKTITFKLKIMKIKTKIQ